MANIGTTAEIYEYRDEEELAGFCIKAKGRQRFHVVESQRQVDGSVDHINPYRVELLKPFYNTKCVKCNIINMHISSCWVLEVVQLLLHYRVKKFVNFISS
jgi:hypothetical protein